MCKIGWNDKGRVYGAIIGARQGFRIKGIQKMLLINGPLMINYHKTIKGIKAFGAKPIDVVYEENDPSAMYTVWLENEKISNCGVSIIPGADHNFAGMEDVFEKIIVKWCITSLKSNIYNEDNVSKYLHHFKDIWDKCK